ncbi:MAG: hypothetical protein CMR00_08725 [[Chlorobium] sp. 445]|nr:MAG: hypothetical protein CMR00_08725 [[Chlorobium] sp. 445]
MVPFQAKLGLFIAQEKCGSVLMWLSAWGKVMVIKQASNPSPIEGAEIKIHAKDAIKIIAFNAAIICPLTIDAKDRQA